MVQEYFRKVLTVTVEMSHLCSRGDWIQSEVFLRFQLVLSSFHLFILTQAYHFMLNLYLQKIIHKCFTFLYLRTAVYQLHKPWVPFSNTNLARLFLAIRIIATLQIKKIIYNEELYTRSKSIWTHIYGRGLHLIDWFPRYLIAQTQPTWKNQIFVFKGAHILSFVTLILDSEESPV